MDKRWILKDKVNLELTEKLCGELNIDSNLASLLVQRNINSFSEAKSFFRPDLKKLHDPFLMKDMNKAVERLSRAVENGEKILVYGDYDVDGTTAVSLVFSFLRNYTSNIDFYIPDRYTEGYGISFQGIDYAFENQFSLIIALDCGIKSLDKVEYANEHGIDFIICDHHLPGENLPEAVAVLDPKREDCKYPYKELSGCGIGFKLIQAYSISCDIPFDKLEQYLDLVAISIGADIVPITDENRVLAFHGLKQINKNPRPGVKAILELANVKKELTITDVVFILGPRINAAGRIASGKNAVELLISNSQAIAKESGIMVNKNNHDRKGLDSDITAQALDLIGSNKENGIKKTTVLFNSEWHKGVIGIVASRLIETYYRPTILLTESNGMATGSARSVKDYDVYKAIESCSDLLEQFGGHKYAAGLTMKIENIDAFVERFENIVQETIDDDLLIPKIEADLTLRLENITAKFHQILKQFAPYGPENMAPVFISLGVQNKGAARIVGSKHLKLSLTDASIGSKSFEAIGFNLGHHMENINNGAKFNVAYTVEENEWNGKITTQLNIRDINFDVNIK